MSAVLPPVKENIYIPTLFGFLGDEGNQRAETEKGREVETTATFLWAKRKSLFKSQGRSVVGREKGEGVLLPFVSLL